MKKQIIMLGIVVLLICVGLSGCEEVGVGLTNIGDITANPNDYIGKEVTVEGTCNNVIFFIMDESGHSIAYNYSTQLTGRYRLTGRVDKINGVLTIQVTKAKGI